MQHSNSAYEQVLAGERAARARAIAARKPLRERVAARLNEIVAAQGSAEMADLELAFPDEVERLTPTLVAEAKKLAGRQARA